ncbi:mineralocorticoid receptor [Dermatophagoides farinae]|uniref:Mineralocorticoid receptor n=1 Tax=Dermatophagoides farinae TaxID=6954 RepID=A0A922I3X5_DERFA|nr:mineralocorticoid receptor [Dermatophagoides farinae]
MTGNGFKKIQEELHIQQHQHEHHNQGNYMMIPMMMFPNHHHHHQTAIHPQVDQVTTATNASNSNSTMPHFSTDDISYSHHLHPTILMAHHHNHSINQSPSSSLISNQEQFLYHPLNHQIFSNPIASNSKESESQSQSAIAATTTSTTTTTIPHHQTKFRYSHHHHHSPSTVISTIGTPPPIHRQLQQQSQPQKQSPTSSPNHYTSTLHSIKSTTKMTNGQSKKITRNDSNSSSSSSSTKSSHHQQCKVCGDTPIGKNFGVVTCGSCKIFFSRNIDSKERLQCRNHNRCMDSINKSNRRNCSACRLDKCIRLGMRVKRNRQKQHSSTTNTSSIESPKIIRNANRSLSESSSNHINGNYSQVLSHDQGSSQASDDIEINDQETGGLDDPMDYVDIPSLVQIEHGAVNSSSNPNNLFSISNCSDYDLTNESTSNQQPTTSAEKDEMLQPVRSESIIQLLSYQQQRQQPLFNSVSVIQQAPPSRPPSSALVVSTHNENDDSLIAESEDEDNNDEEEEDGIEEVLEKQENCQPISYVSVCAYSEQQSSTSKSGGTNNNSNEESSNQMLVPYNSSAALITASKLIGVDEEDIESIEQQTHDGFNYSHVRSSINAHTRYNYSNFYDENYYKYYYLPSNLNNYHDHHNSSYSNDLQQKSSNVVDDDGDSMNNTHLTIVRNRYDDNNGYSHNNRSNLASVELCKVEARNFGDQDHALIADLEKWQPYIRIHMGLDYTTTAPLQASTSTMNIRINEADYQHYRHKLFAKEREKIEYLNSTCRMISAKPQSHDQLRAIFDSLERGIFYANKSFKLYEEFWCESEISELIRQNKTGFIKKKNNLLHMLYHLRGVQNFDDNLNAWAIFNGVSDNGFTMIKLDMFQQSVKKEMAAAHRQYITSFPQEWRKDPTVFNLMTYLLLFGAFDRPHSPFKCDKLTYFQYLYLFKRYFECMYQDEEQAQQMLLWMLKLIRQLSPLCSECLTACTHSLNPAVLKKIGPNYAQCLMMEEKQLKKSFPSSSSLCSSSVSMSLASTSSCSIKSTNQAQTSMATIPKMVPNSSSSSSHVECDKNNTINDQSHNLNADEPMIIQDE